MYKIIKDDHLVVSLNAIHTPNFVFFFFEIKSPQKNRQQLNTVMKLTERVLMIFFYDYIMNVVKRSSV